MTNGSDRMKILTHQPADDHARCPIKYIFGESLIKQLQVLSKAEALDICLWCWWQCWMALPQLKAPVFWFTTDAKDL